MVRGGERARLFVDGKLHPNMHVYAPGVEGYIPIRLTMKEGASVTLKDVQYPPAHQKHLKAINETVPVLEGQFRVQADVIFGQPKEVERVLGPDRSLVLEGTFTYQACDDRQCYVPEEVPLKWTFRYEPHDSTRVPPELRRLK